MDTMTDRTYYTVLALSALIGAVVTWLVTGWVLAPLDLSPDGEVARRGTVVFVGVFTPVFLSIGLTSRRRRDR